MAQNFVCFYIFDESKHYMLTSVFNQLMYVTTKIFTSAFLTKNKTNSAIVCTNHATHFLFLIILLFKFIAYLFILLSCVGDTTNIAPKKLLISASGSW